METGTFTAVGAVIGSITGIAGLTLGILNYRRDRPRLEVSLSWDMETVGHPDYDPKKDYCVIVVRNVSRRTVFYSHPHMAMLGRKKFLFFGKRKIFKHFMIHGTLEEITLQEGDAPRKYIVDQSAFAEYAKDWRHIRGAAVDGAGKHYYSKPSKNPPKWVTK
jgi:hypothetical protein